MKLPWYNLFQYYKSNSQSPGYPLNVFNFVLIFSFSFLTIISGYTDFFFWAHFSFYFPQNFEITAARFFPHI